MKGIYKIQSVCKPNRIYIGSGKNIKTRWNTHLYLLRHNKHHSTKLQRHYNKYGEEDLKFEILTECETNRLIIKEQCYINVFEPYFNCSKIAGSREGVKWSEETRNKRKVVVWSEERRQQQRERMLGNSISLGIKHSEETKAKHRIKLSNETKLKMREHALSIFPQICERLAKARSNRRSSKENKRFNNLSS